MDSHRPQNPKTPWLLINFKQDCKIYFQICHKFAFDGRVQRQRHLSFQTQDVLKHQIPTTIMKGDKNNRRKSTNNISDNKTGNNVIYKGHHHRDANDSQRIIGQPYEPQQMPKTKKERSTQKQLVTGTTNLAGSEKSKKDIGGQHHNFELQSSKQHGARFSSNHTRDRFVVPSIWQEKERSKGKSQHRAGGRHAGDSMGSGGGKFGVSGTTGAKTGGQVPTLEEKFAKNRWSKVDGQVLKMSKKSKHHLFDGQSSQRLDTMTPHLVQRNSAEQLDVEHAQSRQNTDEIVAVGTKSNKLQQFSSIQTPTQQLVGVEQQKVRIPTNPPIFQSNKKRDKRDKRKLEETQTVDSNENSLVKVRNRSPKVSEKKSEQYQLQKPVALHQPSLNTLPQPLKVPITELEQAQQQQQPQMLKLITSATIHLKQEAERLNANIDTNIAVSTDQPHSQQIMTVSRKSRDSNRLLCNNHVKNKSKDRQVQDQKNGIIASSRGLNTTAASAIEEPHSAKPVVGIRDSFNGTSKMKRQMADEAIKPKCPQTCTKTNDKNKGRGLDLNRKSDLVDYKNAMSMTQVDAHVDFVKKRGEQASVKRKPVSALNDDEKNNGTKISTSTGPHSIGAMTTGSIKKQISMTASTAQQVKTVAQSMNSIKVERQKNKNSSDQESVPAPVSDYQRRNKKESSRVIMPQLAQTPQVVLATKYSQSNMSKLSSAKSKTTSQQQTSQTKQQSADQTTTTTTTKAVSQNDQRKQRLVNCNADQGHLTMQSPPNSLGGVKQDRRPLFGHGRTSRTKQVKTYYPLLNQGASSSSTKLQGVTGTAGVENTTQAETVKVQMPHLQANQSSSIQTTNNETLFSHKDSMGQVQSTSNAVSSNYTGTVYRTAAPKFIPAGSIKMQQMKALSTKGAPSANSASIKNFNESKRQMNYSNTGQLNMQNKRAGQRGTYPPFVRGNKRHVLYCSSSESSDSNDDQPQQSVDGEDKVNKDQIEKAANEDHQKRQLTASQQEIKKVIKNSDIWREKIRADSELQSSSQQRDSNGHEKQSNGKEDCASTSSSHSMKCISNADKVKLQQQKTCLRQIPTNSATQSLPPIISSSINAETKLVEIKKKKKAKIPKLVFNLMYTVYPTIKKVAKSLGFRVRTDDIQLMVPAVGTDEYYIRQSCGYHPNGPVPDFDVAWLDNPITPEVLSKVKHYQRISQFPGIGVIANKKKLACGLMKMYKRFPEEYDFFPQTYVLPVDYSEFKANFDRQPRKADGSSMKKQEKKSGQTYIIKPENLCQGKGIFLVRNPNEVDYQENCVAQKYITNPFLMDGLKFDMRLYVLLYGVNPLRVFLFKDGLVRLATEPYVQPTEENIDNLYMHLTNYAINKNNENFVQHQADDSDNDLDDDGTHKRSFKSLIYTLKMMGKPIKKMKREIDDLLIKTLIMAQPSLSHMYKSCQPEDYENQLCFQILGFDVLIDENCKPWLIEVNQSPSFKADSGLDRRIKTQVVTDTTNLLNLSSRRKQRMLLQNRQVMQKRMLTGKKVKLSQEEKDERLSEVAKDRDKFEKANLGKFKMIYPCEDEEKMANYDTLLQASHENWEDFTSGRRRKYTIPNNNVAGVQNNTANDGGVASSKDAGAVDSIDPNKSNPAWKGSGHVVNYVPAWERNFQRSLQQKQARMQNLAQNSSTENPPAIFSARQQNESASIKTSLVQQTDPADKSTSQMARTFYKKESTAV